MSRSSSRVRTFSAMTSRSYRAWWVPPRRDSTLSVTLRAAARERSRWPDAFAIEASFFQALSEKSSPADFQKKLTGLVSRARSANPVVASRANIELAHSMRKTGKADDARRIYDDIVKKDSVDDSARAGAYLGLGLLDLEGEGGKEAAKQALLMFLRVRLETRDAWPSLQAEALYHASQAAIKWQGPEYRYIVGRCRGVLFADFPNSEWAKLAKSR